MLGQASFFKTYSSIYSLLQYLGNPPNRATNNLVESFNSVIKEEMGNQSLDLVTFLETIKSRIFDYQTNQMILAIKKMGDYRVAPEYDHLSIEPIDWSMMNIEQQKAVVKNVFSLDVLPDIGCGAENKKLSVKFEDIKEDIGLAPYILTQLWSSASFILSNCTVSNLLGGNYCVTERNVAYTVSKNAQGIFSCMCENFFDTGGLCPHLLVVADKEDRLRELLIRYSNDECKISKMIDGNKPSKKKAKNIKPRKGANNTKKEPLLQLLHINNSKANIHDPEIDTPKPVAYTKFFHNSNKFLVRLTTDNKCMKNIKQCISCNNEFVRENPKIGEGDLVISHQERYEYPLKDSSGQFLKMVPTRKKLVDKYYCVNKACLLSRHPYFWKGLIQIDNETADKLSKIHYDYLFEQLHFKAK